MGLLHLCGCLGFPGRAETPLQIDGSQLEAVSSFPNSIWERPLFLAKFHFALIRHTECDGYLETTAPLPPINLV